MKIKNDYQHAYITKLPLSLIPQGWLHKMKGLDWRRRIYSVNQNVTVQGTAPFIGKPNHWGISADVTMIVTSNNLTTYKTLFYTNYWCLTTDYKYNTKQETTTASSFRCCSLSTDVELQCFLQRWSVFEWAVLVSTAVLRKQQ